MNTLYHQAYALVCEVLRDGSRTDRYLRFTGHGEPHYFLTSDTTFLRNDGRVVTPGAVWVPYHPDATDEDAHALTLAAEILLLPDA